MGNRLGWILAGALFVGVLMIVAIHFALPRSQPDQPGKLKDEDFKLIVPSAPATLVLARLPDGAGNAGEDYRKAVELYSASKSRMQAAMESADPSGLPADVVETLERIAAHVSAGAGKKQMQYAFVAGPSLIEISYHDPVSKDLFDLGEDLGLLTAYYVRREEYAKAEKVLLDQFTLGLHMMNERSRADAVRRGMTLQAEAVGNLAGVLRDRGGEHAKKIPSLREYLDSLNTARSAYDDKIEVIWTPAPNPVDVFAVIEKDEDPSWRVEAILVLGILRYTQADRSETVRRIERLLDEYASGGGKIEAAAAKAARDLTIEDFRVLGSKAF